MSENTKHTPAPWTLENNQIFGTCNDKPTAFPVAICQGGTRDEADANAALIVRAVNSHADLLAALQAFVCDMDITGRWTTGVPVTINSAHIAAMRAALKKAQGGA